MMGWLELNAGVDDWFKLASCHYKLDDSDYFKLYGRSDNCFMLDWSDSEGFKFDANCWFELDVSSSFELDTIGSSDYKLATSGDGVFGLHLVYLVYNLCI